MTKMLPIEEVRPGLYAQQLVSGEWRAVKPILKDVTQPFSWDNINWYNFLLGGDWISACINLFLLGLIIWFGLQLGHISKMYNDLQANLRVFDMTRIPGMR